MNDTACSLCAKPIDAYDIDLNNLLVGTDRSVDICQERIDAFTAWQETIETLPDENDAEDVREETWVGNDSNSNL